MAAENAPSFTVVALPDTQYYAAAHPEILDAQTRWIARRRDADRIALVVHEGDIVDADEPRQWERAARSLHALDGVVPYVLSAGNHDYRRPAGTSADTLDRRLLPGGRLRGGSRAQGDVRAGHIENSFEIVDAPGGPWLILSLEFGPRDAVLAWADEVASRYAALPAIVVTHAYLHSDDTRYDHVSRPDQLWNPHLYLATRTPGDVNDGEEIWRKLVVRNDNILFVLCGHDLGDGVGAADQRPARRDGASTSCWPTTRWAPSAGKASSGSCGSSPAERRVAVRTYSPYSDRFKTDPDNEFSSTTDRTH